jgi:Winged helix-turn-helix DNA-binding
MKHFAASCLILCVAAVFASNLVLVSPAVDHIRQTVEARIRELRPVIAELEQLEGILALLDESAAVHQLPNISALLAGAPGLAAAPSGPPAAIEPLIRRGRRGTKPGRDGRAPQGANKQLIIATILQRPGISAPEIAQLTGLKRTVVSATINRLKRGGELEPHGGGVRVPLAPPSAVA